MVGSWERNLAFVISSSRTRKRLKQKLWDFIKYIPVIIRKKLQKIKFNVVDFPDDSKYSMDRHTIFNLPKAQNSLTMYFEHF